MLDLGGTRTLEISENKQDLTPDISRCLAISVRESSASVITAPVKPAFVSASVTLVYSRSRLGIKLWHEHILRLGNVRNVFCLSPSLPLIFSAVSKIDTKYQPWLHFLKGTSTLDSDLNFFQCRNCITPQILNSSQETDPTLLEDEYIHYSWTQRYCFGWRPTWKCQFCYFNIWNVSQRITKVLNGIRIWTGTIVLARTYNVHPKFFNFLNYLLITV